MLQLRKLCLWLFFVNSVVNISAYTPTTWIEGTPNNLFSPPCVSNVHDRSKKSSPWQGHVRANLFSVVKPNEYYYGYEGYGIALQGHLHMDRLLKGLYGQLYVPALLVHEKINEWNGLIGPQESHKFYSGSSATIADIPVLIGWEAIQRQSWHVSGYFVGTIPTSKHTLFQNGLLNPFISYNHKFSYGPGLENFVRLWGKPKHHIDWLTNADITFWQGFNGTGVLTWANNSKTFVPVKIHANHMYRVRSDLAYKFKHFIGGIGVQYINIPEEKISLINQPEPHIDEIRIDAITNPSQHLWDISLDIGWEMQLAKLPSYITIGVQDALAGMNTPQYWNINVKLGTQF